MEQDEAEKSLQILLNFLHNLRQKKIDDLNKMQNDILYIKDDLTAVERHKMTLKRAREMHCKKNEGKFQVSPHGTQSKGDVPTSQHVGDLAVMRKKRLTLSWFQPITSDCGTYAWGSLSFSEYYLKVSWKLKHIEFDRDDELFATAGLSRRIKIFDFSLSIMEYEEHEKRAWCVDFSRTDPSMLVSGSDDCKVKVWCTKQEASVLNIDMKANICSVKYNPESSKYIVVGSADHHIHYYDLRNTCHPIHVFSGHKKTVSYVKFLSENELASASTDSTLRLWDVKQNSLKSFISSAIFGLVLFHNLKANHLEVMTLLLGPQGMLRRRLHIGTSTLPFTRLYSL
ncbi:transducin/WD40 repeat-like superfamily protein [Striga asiatica]|uniref:Transducin/WD40 repeat-like superfamily protein n=1 Tax=Striga asiatica TaxID=4170 RepID=A0A5A7PG69_STRAF|nr:transducin/WD40 repeat-like superfamily protein [Striga asiatica]